MMFIVLVSSISTQEGTTILSNGKGHFGPTDRNDQTGQSRQPSKLVPSIPVGPNRNAPFHLMYQPNSPGFWVEWKSPHKIDIITLQHLCHSGKTIVLIKSTLYCGNSTLNHLKKWLKNCSISKPLFQKRWKAFDLWKQSDNARARLENVVENWIHSSPGGSTQQSFIRWCSASRCSPALPFSIPFLTENVPLSYTFYWQMERLSHTYFRTLHPL